MGILFIIIWLSAVGYFIWNDFFKWHGFYEGELPIYKHKIGFNNHGIPRSIETYPLEHPIGFLKNWR